MAKNFLEVVRLIAREDPRYEPGAYFFVREGLDFTLRRRETKMRPGGAAPRHVDGGQLCLGIRDYALEQYGPMAYTLLREWGLRTTIDFGHIVFNLIEYEVFAKNETDAIEDFMEVYSFQEAFQKPFLPRVTRRFNQRNGLPLTSKTPTSTPGTDGSLS